MGFESNTASKWWNQSSNPHFSGLGIYLYDISFSFKSIHFWVCNLKSLRNTELNDGNSTGKSPEKIFLGQLQSILGYRRQGGEYILWKKSAKFFPPPPKIYLSRLSFINGVKIIINHTTFESPNGESGLLEARTDIRFARNAAEKIKRLQHKVPTTLSYAWCSASTVYSAKLGKWSCTF